MVGFRLKINMCVIRNNYLGRININKIDYFWGWWKTVETMICVCHILEAKHGLLHLDTKLLMNGGHGSPIPKLLAKYIF